MGLSSGRSLFGRKSKDPKESTDVPQQAQPPQSNNPYAQQAPSNGNPYAQQPVNDRYTQSASQQQAAPQPATSNYPQQNYSRSGYAPSIAPSYKSAAPSYNSQRQDNYGSASPPPPRYTADTPSYGQQNGYGNANYGTDSKRRPAYDDGQMSDSRGATDDDAGRANLFGNAAQRNVNPQPDTRPGAPVYNSSRQDSRSTMNTDSGRGELFGNAAQRDAERKANPYGDIPGQEGSSFGGYDQDPDREMTEEERQEQDIQVAKDQIKAIKRNDRDVLQDTINKANTALGIGAENLNRLNLQGESIERTRYALERADIANDDSVNRIKELKIANRSMFKPHMNTSRRRERTEEAALTSYEAKRALDDEHRTQKGTMAKQREAEQQRAMAAQMPGQQRGDADRKKYQFEADSEDEAAEDEIHGESTQIGQCR